MNGRLKALIVGLLAVAAIVVGSVVPGLTGSSSSAKDRIAADPQPALFADSAIASTTTDVDAARASADRMIRTWVGAHGTSRDDAAFVAWVEKSFPAPSSDLAAQMPQVAALSRSRTPAGVKAATWLETHGKKDIWKVYAGDQREWLPKKRADDLKAEEKTALKMSKTIADSLGARFGSSAPYVRTPSLRPDHKVKAGQLCPCSYPSRHAAAGAASETLLGTLEPRLDAQYRYLEGQIDFSRVYMAGHFPGDITAGAVLGDLVGDYLLVTREGVPVSGL